MIVDKGEIAANQMKDAEPDMVEVIRCQDCLYWKDEDFCNNPQWHLNNKMLRPCTEPDSFCSYAGPRDA